LGEAFEYDMLDSGPVERLGSFFVSGLDAFEAESVIYNIGSEPFDNPVGKPILGELGNLQGEVGAVAEGE
jgi:hypothetical protein